MTSPILSDKRSSLLRALFRVGLLCATTFGFNLGPEQIAAIQLTVEVVLTLLVQWRETDEA